MHYGEVLVDKSAIDLILRVLDYIVTNLGTSCTVCFNTFTAEIDHSRFNHSCLRLPASTIVDLIF